eukprot:11166914-Prorocentrum_lima.AAC.1
MRTVRVHMSTQSLPNRKYLSQGISTKIGSLAPWTRRCSTYVARVVSPTTMGWAPPSRIASFGLASSGFCRGEFDVQRLMCSRASCE